MDKIRLTEADLHRIVKESVKNVIAENGMEEGWWNQARSAGKTAWNGLKNTVSGDETLGGAWEKQRRIGTHREKLTTSLELQIYSTSWLIVESSTHR